MSNIFETESTSLQHHGILGQKWGVRRFENKNGHLTPAGKARYGSADEKKMAKAQKRLDRVTDKLKTSGTAWDNDTFNNKKMEKYRKVEKKYYKELNKVEKKYNVENTGGLNDYAHYKITGKKDSEKKGLTDKQKKLIIAGAAIAGTALAAYGGYKLSQSVKTKAAESIVNKGNSQAADLMKKAGEYRNLAGSAGNLPGQMHRHTLYTSKAVNTENKAAEVLKKSVDEANSVSKSTIESAKYLARSVKSEGPKSFSKPSQNGPTKEQMTQQKLKAAQESRPKIDRATVSHTPIDRIQVDRATVDRIKVDRTPINMDSFNKAAQANDDLVNSLLKKNAKNLGL